MTNRIQSRSILVSVLLLALFPAVCAAQNRSPQQGSMLGGKYRVAGTVVNAVGGHPLAGAAVVLTDVRNRGRSATRVTGEDGRFEFWAEPGKYSLEAEKRGFLHKFYMQHQQFSTAIVAGAGLDTESLVLRIAPVPVITGKVFDEFGEPVRKAGVMVFAEDRAQGVSRIRRRAGAATDDRGSYEVRLRDEGVYFVAAQAKPWYAVHPASSGDDTSSPPAQVDSALDVAYPLTYYADVADSDDATPIPIRGGDRVEVDIHLHATQALHLTVKVGDDASHGISYPEIQSNAFDSTTHVQPDNMRPVSPGVFEISGIPPGRYSVRLRDPVTGNLREPLDVDLSSSSQELDPSSAQPSSSIVAKVVLPKEEKVPSGLVIALRKSNGRFTGTSVSDEGEWRINDVVTGTYRLLAFAMDKDYGVKILSGGNQASPNTVEIAPGSSLNLTLALVAPGEVTVRGVAKRGGKAASGAMIVLVPKDPEANPELFRRDQSDQDGSFSLPNVIPGEYTILAIDDGWDLDWAKPAVIARYAEHGQNIVVTDQMRHEMQLPDPLEIQTK